MTEARRVARMVKRHRPTEVVADAVVAEQRNTSPPPMVGAAMNDDDFSNRIVMALHSYGFLGRRKLYIASVPSPKSTVIETVEWFTESVDAEIDVARADGRLRHDESAEVVYALTLISVERLATQSPDGRSWLRVIIESKVCGLEWGPHAICLARSEAERALARSTDDGGASPRG